MKKRKAIEVKILEFNREKLKIKVPFAKIPIHIDLSFFKRQLRAGYYKINNPVQIYKLYSL